MSNRVTFWIVALLLCFAEWTVLGQPSQIPSTKYMRDTFLRSTNAATARTALELVSTNQTTLASPAAADVNMGGYSITNQVIDSSTTGDASGLTNLMYLINVVDFGATPSASGDDTAPIQAALDRATNSDVTGGIVYFPSGLYAITNALTISGSGITIKGSGIGHTVIRQYTMGQSGFTNDVNWYGTIEDMSIIQDARTNVDLGSAGIALVYTNYANGASRTYIKNVSCSHWATGFKLHWPVGTTFIGCQAYDNVVGFDVNKSDASVFINCFAGDGYYSGYGSLTNSSYGWYFHSTDGGGWPPFGSVIIGGEGRRAARLIYNGLGHTTVIGFNCESSLGYQVYLSGGYLNMINCRLYGNSYSNATKDTVYVATDLADHLSLDNCEFDDANIPTGYSEVRIDQLNYDVPNISGPSVTVSNASLAAAIPVNGPYAGQVGVTATGGISSTNVQDALAELDSEKLSSVTNVSDQASLTQGGTNVYWVNLMACVDGNGTPLSTSTNPKLTVPGTAADFPFGVANKIVGPLVKFNPSVAYETINFQIPLDPATTATHFRTTGYWTGTNVMTQSNMQYYASSLAPNGSYTQTGTASDTWGQTSTTTNVVTDLHSVTLGAAPDGCVHIRLGATTTTTTNTVWLVGMKVEYW